MGLAKVEATKGVGVGVGVGVCVGVCACTCAEVGGDIFQYRMASTQLKYVLFFSPTSK